jgi:hypothetical protein
LTAGCASGDEGDQLARSECPIPLRVPSVLNKQTNPSPDIECNSDEISQFKGDEVWRVKSGIVLSSGIRSSTNYFNQAPTQRPAWLNKSS